MSCRLTLILTLLLALLAAPALAEEPEKREEQGTTAKTSKAVKVAKPAKKKKKKKMTREQVTAHNTELLATLNEGLPERDFDWKYIVIHHTASEWSSLERIDRYHREKFEDPDGIEYHFLIGNGKKRPGGYIELGRWRLQKLAIHLFKPEGAPQAIAVSLVGNLHERKIKETQYDALLELVARLMKDHDIPIERITTHTGVDGNLTVCPGKHFPYRRLIKDLEARTSTPTSK
jgi:hypothetical protein